MAKKTSLGSAKRFGPRYGRRNKEKLAGLESEHRGRFKCPYCNYVKVRRLSKGIWNCEKCDAKFAGKAYMIPKKKKVKEVFKENFEEVEETEEIEDLEEQETEEQSEDETPEEEPGDMGEPEEEKEVSAA